MSDRTWSFALLTVAALNATVALRSGSAISWFASGLMLGVGLMYLARWVDERKARQDRHTDSEVHVGTWTCPDCDLPIPITGHAERQVTVTVDPTDVYAHALTHEEAS